MKPLAQNLSQKIILTTENTEGTEVAPYGAWGFPENYTRWPENLFQKINVLINVQLMLQEKSYTAKH